MTEQTELAVIGAGPGGYVAAIRAAQLGLDVTLVEKEAYGGVCLNQGCIPSKALITAADVAYQAETADRMGIHSNPSIDMNELQSWKDGVVAQLTGGVEHLCRANGVTLVEGHASFESADRIRVASEDTESHRRIEFEHAIIATGSRPTRIPNFEFDDEYVLSSKTALELDSIPDQLLVVGAGYIGMELSTVYAKLGAEVTVVELLESALPSYENDIAEVVQKRAEALGIDFHFGQSAQRWEKTSTGVRVVTQDEAGKTFNYEAEKVLVAVGRTPNTDTLNLGAAGIETNPDGFISTDYQARTSVDHIFAIGDVAGEPMLAHKASKEGQLAAEAIGSGAAGSSYQVTPAAVFTEPEVATVGMTRTEAEQTGFDPIVGKMPMSASGRALTVGETEGFVRIVADADTELILGGQIVGPEASELIAEITLAIELEATLADLATTIHTHPTLEEAVMEAAAHARGEAIHTLN